MAKQETKQRVNPFQQVIQTYLDKRAAEDELFAKHYQKPNKSIEKCCSYIYGEVKKRAVNNVAVMEDDVVFGMAVHYYEEELAIDKEKNVTKTQSVVKVAASKDTSPKCDVEDVDVPVFDFDLF